MAHTLYWERDPASAGAAPPAPGESITITGEEAAHAAKSKRLRPGDGLRVTDGAGLVCLAIVERTTKSTLELTIEAAELVPAIMPRVEVCSAAPKGQRLDKMLDMLGQTGAASWRPLATDLGVVEPGANKLARAERIAVEALKQSGGGHAMQIEGEVPFAEALEAPEGTTVLIADASGANLSAEGGAGVGSAACVRLLVGPEGGFTERERALAESSGARAVRLGPRILRIETACVIGAGLLLARAATPHAGEA